MHLRIHNLLKTVQCCNAVTHFFPYKIRSMTILFQFFSFMPIFSLNWLFLGNKKYLLLLTIMCNLKCCCLTSILWPWSNTEENIALKYPTWFTKFCLIIFFQMLTREYDQFVWVPFSRASLYCKSCKLGFKIHKYFIQCSTKNSILSPLLLFLICVDDDMSQTCGIQLVSIHK